MSWQEKMAPQYEFATMHHPNGDFELITIKTGDSYPYKVHVVDGKFRLSQSFSPRTYVAPTFKKIKDFDSREEALAAIVKRHNKSCEYMKNWVKIV